jgi:hypothetical protein
MAMALDRIHAEVKRPAAILASFLLLAGAGAWSQNDLPPPDVLQSLRSVGFGPAPEQRQELRETQSFFPDAPSAVPAKQRERVQAFGEAISSLIFNGAPSAATMAREPPEPLTPGVSRRLSALYEAPMVQKEPAVFPDRYLYPSLLRQDLRYHPSTSDSFLDRVSYAATRLFITRDNSGKRKLNTSYLLVTLASAAASSTTYRLYRTKTISGTFGNFGSTQPVSGTFGNFGSSVGGDEGRNIFQQFWPRIQQILGGHSLKILRRAGERTATDPMPSTPVPTSVR